MSNQQLEENQEEFQNKHLASSLGITYDELCQLEWDIDINESNDGIIYGYRIIFSEDSPKKILKKINGIDLSGRYIYLLPGEVENNYDYYNKEIEWDIHSSKQLKVLDNNLDNVLSLLEVNTDEQTKFTFYVMLHAHIVAAMESYLSSTFIHKVTNSDELIRRLIETDPELGKEKLTLKNIYNKYESLKEDVAKYLKNIIFHRLDKVRPMYKSVLNIDFGDIDWLFKAIEIRHHCTHRAGLDKEEEKVKITKNSIEELVKNCKDLSELIEKSNMEEGTIK